MLSPPHDARVSTALAGDFVHCREMIRGGSRSFHAASLLLPTRVRRPAYALYAFCRLSDDAVDLNGSRTGTLARLHERLVRAYAGRPLDHPVDRAFAATVSRFAIPPDLPLALLEGLAWDAAGRRYDTIADLEAYAARVAGSVGAMMALLMGVRDPRLLARACDLGVAMHYTNIARDVGEDARNGRLYLPGQWLTEEGVNPASFLAAPACTSAIRRVVARLLGEADRLYARADAGIAGLPISCRPAITAARLLYAAIGREVARNGFDPVSRRAVVPTRRKCALVARALIGLPRAPAPASAPPLAATRFLVDAAREARPPTRPAAWWDIGGRVVFAIELFDRLERRDRLQRVMSRS
jgi:phytoene synthase